MVQAMDAELGRLLDGLPSAVRADTIVVFVGDNGTPKKVRDADLFTAEQVKGSLSEGGCARHC